MKHPLIFSNIFHGLIMDINNLSFFDANIAAVISKSGFTKSATQLAEKTGVMMLSLDDLEEI